MKAFDIKWNINILDVYVHLDSMSDAEAATKLGISLAEYKKMELKDRYDYVYRHLNYSEKVKFLGLPTEVEVPSHLTDVDNIVDWLLKEYGKGQDRMPPIAVAEFILSRD